MKKLLGISIAAVLAVTPLMANADPVHVTVPETITATNDVASTSYVKGAHKELGVAINSLGTTVGDANSGLVKDTAALKETVGDANSGLVKKVAALESGSQAKLTEGDGINIANDNTISVDAGTGLGINATSKALELSAATRASLEKADSALQESSIETGTANGKIKVGTKEVSVYGLGSAAYEDTTAFDAAGAAGAVETKLESGAANGYAINAKSLQVQGKDVLTTDSSLNVSNIADKAITKAKLEQNVQDSLDLADSALQKADITTGTEQMANGTISVEGTAVAVKGLKSAAFAETTAFDSAGAATTAKNAVETKLTTGGGASGYDIDAKTLKVQGTTVLTTASSLDGAKLTSKSVATGALADGAVTTAKIADANVTTGKLAANAVTTAKIADANVTTAKIADLNVTTDKLAASAVTTAKIADANVTTAKIADSNVTTAKIADGAVTADKLGAEIQLYSGWNEGKAPVANTTTVALVAPVHAS